MTRKVLIVGASKRASQEIVLGAGLEPAQIFSFHRHFPSRNHARLCIDEQTFCPKLS
jgi:hypothetical protein